MRDKDRNEVAVKRGSLISLSHSNFNRQGDQTTTETTSTLTTEATEKATNIT